MIAQWKASVLFSFYSKTDVAIASFAPPAGLIIRPLGDKGFRYYHKSSDELSKVKTALGEEFSIGQVWSWSAVRSTILNVPSENLEKFNDPVTFELKIATLGSKKSRHELHMIALPGLVYSVAVAMGYNPPTISFSDLIGNQVIFDDAFQTRMIGSPDAKEADPGHYTKSQLWQQRMGLWRGLGEEDATKYYPKGKGTKYDSTSDKLSACLNYLTHDWGGAMWARVVQVPDPRVDAIYGDDKRLSIPAMTEIFASQAAAIAVAQKENAERAQREAAKNGSTTPANSGDSTIPEAWRNDPTEWNNWITGLKTQFAGKPPPVVKASITKLVTESEAKGESIGATVEEILTALKA
jgi:hypothetical protein